MGILYFSGMMPVRMSRSASSTVFTKTFSLSPRTFMYGSFGGLTFFGAACRRTTGDALTTIFSTWSWHTGFPHTHPDGVVLKPLSLAHRAMTFSPQ
jgi:hypothetical protein